MFGKWHLGDIHGRFPTDQGFDEWYGVANTTDESEYSSQLQYDPEVATKPVVQESTNPNKDRYSDNLRDTEVLEASLGKKPTFVKKYDVQQRRLLDSELTDRAITFMKKSVKEKKPFFAFVPFTQPHLPTLPHPSFDGKTGNGHYADVLAEIDYRSGQILDAIDDLKIRNNTVVIWLSDNGPEYFYPWHGTAGPWRGNYCTVWEGSLRAPFLIRWPNKIKAGSVSNEIVHAVDILPTLGSITGYQTPSDRIIDGVDQLDFFLGQAKGIKS